MDRKRKLAFAIDLLNECDVAFTYICKGDAETAFDNVFSDEDWTILKDKITEQNMAKLNKIKTTLQWFLNTNPNQNATNNQQTIPANTWWQTMIEGANQTSWTQNQGIWMQNQPTWL